MTGGTRLEEVSRIRSDVLMVALVCVCVCVWCRFWGDLCWFHRRLRVFDGSEAWELVAGEIIFR